MLIHCWEASSQDRMATLSNLNEMGHTKMYHDFEPWLIAVLMHTSVAVMYQRFD